MNNFPKTTIKIISSSSESKLKEKSSTFIGQAFFADDEDTALGILNETRKKYYDATHNCYAYRLFNGKFKYSDDGEPNGTAGIRIFNAIEHFNIQNILVVVTRYYGGIKLGVGPLGKAYYQSAYDSLNQAEIAEKIYYQKIRISYDYSFIKTLHKVIADFEGVIINNLFDTAPYSECLIYPGIEEKLAETLKNLSSGKVIIEKYEQFLFR
jgi:uncharacterized YigZ family protein